MVLVLLLMAVCKAKSLYISAIVEFVIASLMPENPWQRVLWIPLKPFSIPVFTA
jgi:hypothetical protein